MMGAATFLGKVVYKKIKVHACVLAISGVDRPRSGVFKLFLVLLNPDGERSAFVWVCKFKIKCQVAKSTGDLSIFVFSCLLYVYYFGSLDRLGPTWVPFHFLASAFTGHAFF